LKQGPFRGDIPVFMRGLWLEAQSLRLRDDVPLPSPPPDEALVRVTLAGICNTDLELVGGYYPFSGIPGHEFVGRVERAPLRPEWVGRRVVGEINASCGACPACRAGRPTHCENRTVLGIKERHGAFAEYLALPVANLHTVPDALPDEVAVFTEPTAAALEIQQQVRIGPADRVVVIGPGKLGSLVAQSLVRSGCNLVVVGRSRKSLDRLASLGIRTVPAADVPDRIADVVVECTGNPEGLALARKAVRPRGTIVLKSTYRGETSVDLSSIVVDEVTLVGSRCGPFDEALRALADGSVDVRSLVEARYPLSGGLAAFEHAARPGALKVLVEC
jgi:threonine dehydrogenase-like Zn-dependent dehydrogenase